MAEPNTKALAGKVALITGTGQGQGRAAALRFAAEGAKVVGCGRDPDKAAATLKAVLDAGGEMISMAPVDLSDEGQAEAWVHEGAAHFGGVDIVYNNASHARFGPFGTMSGDDWRYTIRNELDIVFYVTRAAWPYLVARGGGSIITTSSVASLRGYGLPQSLHGAAKGGVNSLMTNLVLEGGPHQIRVNTISPGVTEHPVIEAWASEPGSPMAKLVDKIPLGRIGRAKDVASLALFLASDDAAYITGANIVIDGGLSQF